MSTCIPCTSPYSAIFSPDEMETFPQTTLPSRDIINSASHTVGPELVLRYVIRSQVADVRLRGVRPSHIPSSFPIEGGNRGNGGES